MKENIEYSHDKASPEALQKIRDKIEEMRTQVNYPYEFRNEPERFYIDMKDENGNEKTVCITKVDDESFPKHVGWQYIIDKKTKQKIKVPKYNYYPYEEIVEATLRFPNDSLWDAVEKTKQLKEEAAKLKETK